MPARDKAIRGQRDDSSERKFPGLLESAPDGVVIVDAAGLIFHWKLRPISPMAEQFHICAHPTCMRVARVPGAMTFVPPVEALGHQHFHRLPDQFSARKTEQELRLPVDDLISRAGTQPLEVQPVDTSEVVDRLVNDLASVIAETGASVNRDILPTVPGDATQLRQVSQNLEYLCREGQSIEDFGLTIVALPRQT